MTGGGACNAFGLPPPVIDGALNGIGENAMARTSWSIVTLVLLGSAGCQSTSSFQFSTLWEDHAPVGTPNQVGAMWLDGVDVKPDSMQGGVLVPGFAGRIYFM